MISRNLIRRSLHTSTSALRTNLTSFNKSTQICSPITIIGINKFNLSHNTKRHLFTNNSNSARPVNFLSPQDYIRLEEIVLQFYKNPLLKRTGVSLINLLLRKYEQISEEPTPLKWMLVSGLAGRSTPLIRVLMDKSVMVRVFEYFDLLADNGIRVTPGDLVLVVYYLEWAGKFGARVKEREKW